MSDTIYKSPLHETVTVYPTDFWNDSCSVEELAYAIHHGAVGATSNPTIVEQVLDQERDLWKERIHELIADNPSWSDEDVTSVISEEIALKGAELLLPVFERENGMKGRLSIQTNPSYYRSSLAPNMQVKLPATSQGIVAMEEATFRGVNINATVSFTVPQAVAIGEAVDRGLRRREAEGLPTDNMTPVTTIMVGRTDDWIRTVTERDGITVNPGLELLCSRKHVRSIKSVVFSRACWQRPIVTTSTGRSSSAAMSSSPFHRSGRSCSTALT